MNLMDLARKATSLGLPSLGKALGGPLGEAAGTVLARTLGLQPTASRAAKRRKRVDFTKVMAGHNYNGGMLAVSRPPHA